MQAVKFNSGIVSNEKGRPDLNLVLLKPGQVLKKREALRCG